MNPHNKVLASHPQPPDRHRIRNGWFLEELLHVPVRKMETQIRQARPKKESDRERERERERAFKSALVFACNDASQM